VSSWFIISLIGFIVIIIPYFFSLEHLKLEEKYGRKKGKKIGDIYGLISGWGFFLFLFGIWFSPQERFINPILTDFSFQISLLDLRIYLINFIIFIPLFVAGVWLGIKGVIQTTLKVAETHRAKKVITKGVYSIIRHPQYLGAILAHIGFSFLLSALQSLLITPLIIALIFILSWKEEKELTKEFGQEYKEYKKSVPMLIPKIFH
jgi:protein-S-isoprenylcysteine O-methyltransferase Ste14